jgi:hypothetical protein
MFDRKIIITDDPAYANPPSQEDTTRFIEKIRSSLKSSSTNRTIVFSKPIEQEDVQ